MADLSVKAWAKRVKIPTYRLGPPDKNSEFFEKWGYQGSNDVVYPHPVIDRFFDEKYNAENTTR